MKRLIIQLVTALVTFFVGIALSSLITTRPDVKPKVPDAETAALKMNYQREPDIMRPRPPNPLFDYDPKKFNPRGDYFIVGRKPRGFSEFEGLELAVDHKEAVGVIFIESHKNQSYDAHYAVSGLVTNKRLTFVVPAVSEDGVEYFFDGYFLRGGVLSDAGKNTAVLKGKLSKSKGGVRIAEAVVKFRIKYLGC